MYGHEKKNVFSVKLIPLFVHSRYSRWIDRGGFEGPRLSAEEKIGGP